MRILLPDDVDWSPASWVSRGLFEGLLELDELPPAIATVAQFCVDAQLDTLDLRGTNHQDLRGLRRAVAVVLERTEAEGALSFQLPGLFPVYVDELRELAATLDGLEDRRFAFQCHRTWNSLSATSDPNVRHCGECRQDVHLCATLDEAVTHARDHHCVALPARPHKTIAIGMPDPSPRLVVAWLVPLDGPQAGKTLRLPAPPCTVGRGPADVVIDDPELAAAHLVFEDRGGFLDAYDARVPAGPARVATALGLYDGRQFTIGRTRLVFRVVD